MDMAFQQVWGSFSPSSRTALSLEDLADLSDLPHPILDKQRGDLIGSYWEVPSRPALELGVECRPNALQTHSHPS